MGADQSSEKLKRSNNNLTKDEVEKIIEQQRKIFEAKYNEILKTAKGALDASIAQQTVRNEAYKEVERIIANQRGHANSGPAPAPPIESLERQRTPYSFSQNDLHIGVAQTTATNIYPNLNTHTGTPTSNLPSYPARQQLNIDSYVDPKNGYTSPNNPPNSNASTSRGYSNPTMGFAKPNTTNSNSRVNMNAANINNRNSGPNITPMPSAPPASRDRSASRQRNKDKKNVTKTKEDDELNCPTCKQKFTVNIYQCSRGHSSCSNCKGKNNNCGICALPITEIRNRSLEEYIAERKIRCPNSKDGCTLFIKMAHLDIHAKECPFQEMNCPLADLFGRCSWRGKLPQMASHFDEVHPMHRQASVDTEMFLLNCHIDNQVVYFVTIGSFNFIFHLKVSEYSRMIYMTVQLIGTNHSAEKWTYEINLYDKNQPRKKYQFLDACHSHKTTLTTIIDQGKCAMIPFAYADNFQNNGRLSYKFFIKREGHAEQGGVRRRF